jgi:hypothetical protein
MKARNAHNTPIIEQYHRETRNLPHEERPTLDSWLEENGLQLKAGGGSIKELENAIRQSKGEYGAKRVQRAADEIPGLENMYTMEALHRAFGGDNAKALMSMNPADFEKFANILSERTGPATATDKAFAEKHGSDKFTLPTEDYVKYLSGIKGFSDVPQLHINKEETGLPIIPYIDGHEGRHRNRALSSQGVQSNLIQLVPRSDLRESLPRMSQEEYINALRDEMAMSGNKVYPENGYGYNPRDPIQLPDVYAEGGLAHMAIGGGMKRNWPKGEVEQWLEPLHREGENAEPINQWINANLANYVKKQMAGPDDPVRKLAEQGISHLPPWGVDQLFGPPEDEGAAQWRKDYLQGGEQLGKSDLAKRWENASDQALYPKEVRELMAYGKGEPWMENLNHKDLLMSMNSSSAPRHLGFSRITAHLKHLLDSGKLRPEQLNKVTMEQVVKQMHQEREAKARKEREESLKNTEGMPVHSTYPNGWRWQELAVPEEDLEKGKEHERKYLTALGKRVGESTEERVDLRELKKQLRSEMGPSPIEKLQNAIKNEGEMMGHCLQNEEMEWPKKVMNGNSRLFSLRDEKNEPHVTIEMHPAASVMKHFMALPENEQLQLEKEVIDQHFGGVPPSKHFILDNKHSELMRQHYLNKYGQPGPSIAQIYGKQDKAPIGEYIPYVQDFVHSVNPSSMARQAAQNAQLNDMNENYNAKLREWLDKKGIQYPRYMTDKERWGHEENRMREAMGTADQNPFAKGGTAKPLHFARNTDEMRLALKKAK